MRRLYRVDYNILHQIGENVPTKFREEAVNAIRRAALLCR